MTNQEALARIVVKWMNTDDSAPELVDLIIAALPTRVKELEAEAAVLLEEGKALYRHKLRNAGMPDEHVWAHADGYAAFHAPLAAAFLAEHERLKGNQRAIGTTQLCDICAVNVDFEPNVACNLSNCPCPTRRRTEGVT